MKKIVSMFVLAVVAVVCFSSCYKEEMDTFVKWGFAESEDSEISNGLEQILPSAAVIFDAFDTAFLKEYDDLGMSHEALMRAQSGKSSAVKHAKNTAKKAHSMIEEGHTCPVDYIFVVQIKYNSNKYETVWSHDYRAK